MESYFRRCAKVFGSVRSLTATNSRFLSASDVRSTLRPMRPNPLMPTFTAIFPPKECLIATEELAGQPGQLLMLTGHGRQRKCHPSHPDDDRSRFTLVP